MKIKRELSFVRCTFSSFFATVLSMSGHTTHLGEVCKPFSYYCCIWIKCDEVDKFRHWSLYFSTPKTYTCQVTSLITAKISLHIIYGARQVTNFAWFNQKSNLNIVCCESISEIQMIKWARNLMPAITSLIFTLFQYWLLPDRRVMSSSLEPRQTGIVVLESASLIFLNVVSLVGNILICWAVFRNPHLRTTTNLYIVALAACDLGSAIFVMPFSTAVLITGEWFFGDIYCNIQGFFVVLNIYASPCLMTLTAFNRYVRIVKTNIYHKLFSMRKCKLWILAVYVVVAAYVLTQVFVGNQKIQFVPGYAVCSTTHLRETAKIIHYSIVIPAFVIGPILITSACYYKIFRAIRLHTKNIIPSLRSESTASLSISSRELKISISLFVVVIVFACCWIPLWILALLFRFQLVKTLNRHVTLFIMFLVFFSSTINPFIYAGMNGAFRSELRRICGCSHSSNQDSTSFNLRQAQCRRSEDGRKKNNKSLDTVEMSWERYWTERWN